MNNNALTIFQSKEFDEVRTTIQDGEPWFVAADVCRVLGITNSRNAVSRLDDDEKGVHSMDTPSGTQNMSIINESGVYSIIFTSRKPEAKAFKRWVTHDVLPTLRKQGYYSTMSDEELFDTLNKKVHGNDSYMASLATAALDKRWNDRMARCGALWNEHGLDWKYISYDGKDDYQKAFDKIWYEEGYGWDYNGFEAAVRKLGDLMRKAEKAKRKEDFPRWPMPEEFGYDYGKYSLARKHVSHLM